MRVHQIPNGQYVDLDHVLAVGQVTIHSWGGGSFDLVLAFHDKPFSVYFPDPIPIDWETETLDQSKKEQVQARMELRRQDFVNAWKGQESG
jgi:hypothetical protein